MPTNSDKSSIAISHAVDGIGASMAALPIHAVSRTQDSFVRSGRHECVCPECDVMQGYRVLLIGTCRRRPQMPEIHRIRIHHQADLRAGAGSEDNLDG